MELLRNIFYSGVDFWLILAGVFIIPAVWDWAKHKRVTVAVVAGLSVGVVFLAITLIHLFGLVLPVWGRVGAQAFMGAILVLASTSPHFPNNPPTRGPVWLRVACALTGGACILVAVIEGVRLVTRAM